MNGYTVEWLPDAEDALADIWTDASDRAAVTAAEAAIERLLRRNPFGNGIEVAEGLYKPTVDPLTVYYSVDPGRSHVEVSQVWRSQP